VIIPHPTQQRHSWTVSFDELMIAVSLVGYDITGVSGGPTTIVILLTALHLLVGNMGLETACLPSQGTTHGDF
jgi:hypothetical protein